MTDDKSTDDMLRAVFAAVMNREVDEMLAQLAPVFSSTIRACPECLAGKHGNCPGDAWDDELDRLVDCPCSNSGHGHAP